MAKRKVLITGATGKIGRTLMEDLADVYELTGTSRRPSDDPRMAQLELDDVETVASAFRGHDAVVLMHGFSTGVSADLNDYLQPNIVSVRNVYEAVRLAGVPRVVFASSNHATGWHEASGARSDAASDFRPDSIYGATKAWGEAFGRYYADRFGLQVVCLRIGSYLYRKRPPDWGPGKRILSTWISDRDMVQLVRRSIEASEISWGVYYGISNNSRAYWDLTNAAVDLGYAPLDNAEDYAAEVPAATEAAARNPYVTSDVQPAPDRREPTGERLKVLITGATGQIGRTLMEDLGDVFELTGTSRQPSDDPRFRVLGFDDIDTIAEAFAGQDVVVHMHAKSNHDDDDFDAYLTPNMAHVFNTYEAARRAGVRRVIFASSNHATGWYELAGERCDAESVVRPDSIYGAAKVWGEALGRLYSDRYGLEVISLRIGSYRYRADPSTFDMGARILSSWLSAGDLVQLVRRSIETPGTRHGIYYGVSNNARAHWDLTNAALDLGYRPRDDAENYADAVLAKGGTYRLWEYTFDGIR